MNIRLCFLVALLLVPQKSIFITVVGSSLVIWLFSLKAKKKLNNYFNFLFLLVAVIILGIFFRFVFYLDPDGRDLFELGRFVPLLLLLSVRDLWKSFRAVDIANALLVFLAIDGAVSLGQLAGISLPPIEKLYNSPLHVENALLISNRLLGLSPGPGQHGALLFLVYCFFLASFFLTSGIKKRLFFGLFISLIMVLGTQSQTALIVTFCTSIIALCIFAIKLRGFERRIAVGTLIALVVMAGQLIYWLNERFPYLASLLEEGLKRSSFLKREEKWALLLDSAFSEPLWFTFGWGKEFFGATSGAMDSEWLYVFLVYGALVFFAMASIWLIFLLKTGIRFLVVKNGIQPMKCALWLIAMGGGVFAYPSAFFTQINIACMVTLFVVWSYWENIYDNEDSSASASIIDTHS